MAAFPFKPKQLTPRNYKRLCAPLCLALGHPKTHRPRQQTAADGFRSRHGLMIQMLAGLVTYILLAIYCHDEHGEPVSIHRVR